NKMDEETGRIHGCLYKGVSWEGTKMFGDFEYYDNTKDTFYGFEMKYPELDDSDTVDWVPLMEAINFANNSTDEEFQQHIGEYFDIPVITDYNIFFNVVNAVDNSGKNMYWAVYDKDSTRCLTPAPWDLDATFGQRWGGMLVTETDEGFYNSPEFMLDFELMVTYRFYRDNFNDYIGQLNERYKQLRLPGQPLHTDSIIAIVDRYYQAVKRSGAATREEAKWSGDSDMWGDVIDFDTEYAYICNWIRHRMEFIDQTELPLFYKKSYFDELGISNQMSEASLNGNNVVYDLSGRKVAAGKRKSLKPGLYIRGGRRVTNVFQHLP
ncbi:MAG: CotH kinase family protein, partial [Prevotella sp.]|nr:CotH kinase family protein [Prevotella sp.]